MKGKALIGLVVVVAMMLVLAVGASGRTTANVKHWGWVYCYGNPNEYVVGVWVDVKGGGSGWAWWKSASASQPYTVVKNSVYAQWAYTFRSGASYRLTVGCGGSKSKWATTNVGKSWTTATFSEWSCITPNRYCERVG